MKYSFSKLQGLGNDFILFDNIGHRTDQHITLTPQLATQLCDRRFGIGADGVFSLATAADQDTADLVWDFYNADGSVAEMCGNAIRCVARYIFDRGLWPLSAEVDLSEEKNDLDGLSACKRHGTLRIETLAGIKAVTLQFDNNDILQGFRVDMGIAELGGKVNIAGRDYQRVCVGNPHAVTFVDHLPPEFGSAPVATEGPVVELDPAFPQKTNVEFVQLMSSDLVYMRVWERGVGETLACATGACAVAVAAHDAGLSGARVTVMQPRGALIVEIADDLRVHLTGPAEGVYLGIWSTLAVVGDGRTCTKT
ncbi:MAG: diaminopimelate epimerase [Coriobacteriia bacterium]|nr:diaminopimelate epimerase [Coriobacteriia bacterium]